MKNGLTIKTRLFLTIAIILAVSYAVLFFSSVLSIQRFSEEEIAKDLEASLRFAKVEFRERSVLVLEALKLPVSAENIQRLFANVDSVALKEAADRWAASLEFEMLTFFDARQKVIVRHEGAGNAGSFLRGHLLNSLFDRRQPIVTIELVPHEQYCQEVSTEVCQALPENKDVMVQLVLLPVIDKSGKVLGAIVAGDDVNKNPYLPYLQQKVFGKSVEMLITQMGERIASSVSAAETFPVKLDDKVLQSLKAGFLFTGKTALHGVKYEMLAEPLHNHKGDFIGAIAVALPQSQFSAISRENFSNLLLSAVVSITLIFVLAYFTARQFTLPIHRFLNGVRSIEKGDYSCRLPESGSLEFRTLAETFNRMVGALSERDTIIGAQNSELLALNSQLEARVTERAAELEAEVGRQKAIVTSLLDGLIVADSQQHIVQVNPAAESLLGLTTSKLVGAPLAKLAELPGLHELDRLLARERPANGCSTAETVTVLGSERRRLRFAVTDLLDGSCSPCGVLLGISAMTGDGEVDRLKSDFIAKVSHELKTPLTSMKGSLQFILKKGKWLTGVEREMLGVCLRNTERLIALVASILELSKIEAGQVHFSMRPLQIGEVVLYSLEEVKATALQKNISLINDIGVDLPKVYGDYDRLGQVLSNLLANAVKFSPRDSVVSLAAEVNADAVLVSIADGGTVIPEEDRAALFSKFQQVGRPEEGNASGSGLGLAICKEIMERHGGTITHAPAASGGNVFTITVPLYGEINGTR